MAQRSNPAQVVESRRKFALAFNQTLLNIWQERIVKLDAYRTGTLYKSLQAIRFKMNDNVSELEFGQKFRAYGVYVDEGTGKEISIGNPGDIGRDKVRKAKRWFYPKYYGSFRKIVEYMAESFGQEAVAIVTNTLNRADLRNSIK